MPDEATLAEMYGPAYETSFRADQAVEDPKEPQRVLEWLRRLGRGVFLDYGCGSGSLLVQAAKLGWEPIGVELDPSVAQRVTRRTGMRVVSEALALPGAAGPPADVVHLGDVIEHLTALDRQMPLILRLLKPGGVLLAQGPLEANPNLFTFAVRLARSLRRGRTEVAPYHVLLATAGGQRALFRRCSLIELEFQVSEVPWPAPAKLSCQVLRSPRGFSLFLLRRLSQAATALRPSTWGNRYFYAGQWEEGTRSPALSR
jgi:SAM-dependent methyltransferase